MAQVSSKFQALLLLAVALLIAGVARLWAEDRAVSPSMLVDRVLIEDMLVDYYALIDHGATDYSAFYVPDGVLDVNGVISRGPEQIKDLYRKMFQMAGAAPGGKFHLIITNQKILVRGNSATADFIWTDVADKSTTERPSLAEQGREHDDLVKRDGRWLLKTRVIRTDAGRLIGSDVP